MKTNLTKTLLKLAVNCQRLLLHALATATSESGDKKVDPVAQHLISQGYKVEEIATSLFPNAKTQKSYIFNGVFTRVDIINNKELIEVKSSTTVKDEHLLDVAIQYYILSGSGIDISCCKLALINKDYVRATKLNPKNLIKVINVTAHVLALLPEVELLINKCKKYIEYSQEPPKEIGNHCFNCPHIKSCSPNLLSSSVFDLRRGGKKSWELYDLGISQIKDIPDSTKLTQFQNLQKEAAVTSNDYIDKTSISHCLNQLKYPLYFLDFEAFTTAIPRYKGNSPYDQITFQASLHVQYVKDGRLSHFEYLHDTDSDPRNNIAKFLKNNIGTTGSVIAYHASYEKGRMVEMANLVPKYKYQLESIIDRLWDLEDIFSKGFYVSEKLKGSTSIKKVLPVLSPELSYNDLDIQNGQYAFIQYLQMIDDKATSGMKREIYNSLLQYCKMDTYAMYAILEALLEVCHE